MERRQGHAAGNSRRQVGRIGDATTDTHFLKPKLVSLREEARVDALVDAQAMLGSRALLSKNGAHVQDLKDFVDRSTADETEFSQIQTDSTTLCSVSTRSSRSTQKRALSNCTSQRGTRGRRRDARPGDVGRRRTKAQVPSAPWSDEDRPVLQGSGPVPPPASRTA